MKLGAVGRTVRLGMIGVGHRGLPQLDLLLAMPDVEVLAVCDVYEDRVKEAQEHVTKAKGNTPAGFHGQSPCQVSIPRCAKGGYT